MVQGKREQATFYGEPESCARRWIEEGAEALHVVNLDGAFGAAGRNATLIRRLIRETGVMVQLGGGIRSRKDAVSWLETGVDRIILGTLAVLLGTWRKKRKEKRPKNEDSARPGP